MCSYINSYCRQNERIIWLFISSTEACHIWNMELIYSKGHYFENRWRCCKCKTRFHLPLSLFLYFFLSFTFLFSIRVSKNKPSALYFSWKTTVTTFPYLLMFESYFWLDILRNTHYSVPQYWALPICMIYDCSDQRLDWFNRFLRSFCAQNSCLPLCLLLCQK